MNKLEASIRPSVAKLICRNYPIIKKRCAISFFFDEVRNNNCDSHVQRAISEAKSAKGRTPTSLRSIWNKLDLNHKRKYYELAQLDENRFKEQTSLWITKVADIVESDQADYDKLKSMERLAPDPHQSGLEAVLLMSKYQRKFEPLIQADSITRMVKDAIKLTENKSIHITEEQLVSSIPQQYRPILHQPIKPKSPYIMFMLEHGGHIKRANRTKYPEKSFFQVCSYLWSKLAPSKKEHYVRVYEEKLKAYHEEMEKFKASNEQSLEDDVSLTKLIKIRRTLSGQIRKKMRSSEVIPVQVRNPFIFFFKENYHLRGKNNDNIVNAYLNLSEEEKTKYQNMSKQDQARYEIDKKRYLTLVNKLIELMKKQNVVGQ